MNDQKNQSHLDEPSEWLKKTFNKGVHELNDIGIVAASIVEARPVWTFPYTLIIGKIRKKDSINDIYWMICGDCPSTAIEGSLAETPRDAAKHFGLQWQLQSINDNTLNNTEKSDLSRKAESLLELTETDVLWN